MISKIYFILLIVIFSGCASRKVTTTETVTIVKVDTLILVQVDTVPQIIEKYKTDTLYLENEFSRAVSYLNPITGTITLSLTEKPFSVPITINTITTVKEKTKEITKKNFLLKILLTFLAGFIAGTILTLKIKK